MHWKHWKTLFKRWNSLNWIPIRWARWKRNILIFKKYSISFLRHRKYSYYEDQFKSTCRRLFIIKFLFVLLILNIFFVFILTCQRPQNVTQYLKMIENSGWLKHRRVLLECGNFIAESILWGISCVVHCSGMLK